MRAKQYNQRPPAVYAPRRAKAQEAAQPADVDLTLPAAFVALAIAMSVGAYTLVL